MAASRKTQWIERPLGALGAAFLAAEAGAHDLARAVLADRYGVVDAAIDHDRRGAPFLPGRADLHISLAARGGLAAFACARAPVGVDVEPLADSFEPPWGVLHAREAALLRQNPEHAMFLRIWTGKEAYLKARGLGLRREPAEFAALPGAAETLQIEDCGRLVACEGFSRRDACAGLTAVWTALALV
ncbi:MAG: 4'-phosphopantetheinyl transferase superfamily protein [Hyphomicrobiales bacterium]|nr:4'-phosphopantetheinyl transferase superfamily protein [Hyphomicrobiales bacterium]